jgi:WD40 repeat protein
VRVEVASSGATRAETTVNVLLRREIVVGDAPADAASHFTGTPVRDPARAAQLVYPLNGAVMPQNVYPADLQWLQGNAGDLYRVRLRKRRIDVVAYVQHSGPSFQYHWLVEQSAWRALAQTEVDDPVEITVDRWDAAANQVVTSDPVRIRFANGSVSGTIYYWDIAAGRAIRIDDGTAERQSFMPTPPPDPGGDRCVGCHAVSRDGRYFAGRLGGGDTNRGAVFDLTTDLSGNPPPTLFTSNDQATWNFATFSPDNTRLMIDPNTQLALLDPRSGTRVPLGPGSAPLPRGTHPTWSPDGNTIAFISDTPAWGVDLRQGNVSVLDVLGPDTFGAPRMVHMASSLSGAVPGGLADSYPSWSPDSRWLAFGHGDIARSDVGQGALYLTGIEPGATAVRLDRACGGADRRDNYLPNFSPFNAGGYFWLSFLSKRDYGNAHRGTRGAGRQQVWVTAIRNHPDGTTDPSEVAYWLPGQNPQSSNISAFWAPRPCRPDGEVCSVGSECCSGLCRDGHCQPPPEDMCRRENQPCGGAGCCPGLECVNNVCQAPPG